MAKPSKRKWAVMKRERRVLAQRAKAKKVADRLLGGRRIIGIDHSWQDRADTAYQMFCKHHAPK